MKADKAVKIHRAMTDAWRDWHADLTTDEVPRLHPHFKDAWLIQQKKIDELNRRIRVLKFAIHSASEVIEHGTQTEMRETAAFLKAINRITEGGKSKNE